MPWLVFLHDRIRLPMLLSLLLIAIFSVACVDHTRGFEPAGDRDDSLPAPDGDSDNGEATSIDPWAITVVGTDYLSTSISIIDRETQTLFREGILHSGSTPPGLSIALSGDVVFPRQFNPEHWIVLIDRYPNSVLTFIRPDDLSVAGQLSVATGFASNPHDFLWIDKHKAYVTRYERNPQPQREAFDGGDDILIVDPTDRNIIGRIDLRSLADTDVHPDMLARPEQLVLAENRVWVTLDEVSGDFQHAGTGRIAIIDPENDELVGCIDLEDITNCTSIVHSPSRHALYVSCTGLFEEGPQEQLQRSALVEIDLNTDPPESRILVSAHEGAGQPFGFELDIARQRYLLAMRFGDLANDIPDRLVAFDLDTNREFVVHKASTPFGLGGFLADDAADVLYVGEADPEHPRILLYRPGDDAFNHIKDIDAHPESGLPPRHIRFY